MRMNSEYLESCGRETIYNGRETFKRTVYYSKVEHCYFIKLYGEIKPVYRVGFGGFSINKPDKEKIY